MAQFAYIQVDFCANGNSVVLGDPDMVILNPEEYNIKMITLFASFDRTPEYYLNVFMKTWGRGGFRINGNPPVLCPLAAGNRCPQIQATLTSKLHLINIP